MKEGLLQGKIARINTTMGKKLTEKSADQLLTTAAVDCNLQVISASA
jgi:hypothetical protein